MKTTQFTLLRSMVFMFLFTLCGTSTFAQPMCPGGGWENEPIQDPDNCCILFDMLPSTLDFPWAYWFVVANGETFNNATYPDGNFEVCYEEAGMKNVVVTYVDAAGITLCENDWTVFVEGDCGDPIPCEDCVEIIDINADMVDDCTYDFEVTYDDDLGCGNITIESITWDYEDMGATGTGATNSHTFSGDGTYNVSVTIKYTVDETGETCTQESTLSLNVTGCDIPCENCIDLIDITAEKDDNCTYNFSVTYDDDQGCGDITIESITWDFDDMGATETGTAVSHTFSGDDTYNVSVTIKYTVTETGETCTRTTNVSVLVSDCGIPCEDCIEFIDITVEMVDDCEYDFSITFTHNPECDEISFGPITWNFDDMGASGSGHAASHTFSGDGTYNISVTVEYTVTETGETCTQTTSVSLTVTGCEEECNSCLDDECIDLDEIVVFPVGGCSYLFVLDYTIGDCGEYAVIEEAWVFGDGTTGTGGVGQIQHTFPVGGPYTVCATLHYMLDGELEAMECTISTEISCGGNAPKSGEGMNESGQINAGSGITATTAPNPADEEVSITILDPNNSSDAEQLQLVVFDINGRQVYRGDTRYGLQKMIDVSSFESGMYIYEIRSGETVLLQEKLMVK